MGPIPAAVKIALLAWLAVWMPLRAAAYPASSWLDFCAFGSVILTIGIVMESRLLVSWQAIALTIGQFLYILDALLARQITSYLFAAPVEVRVLSLFHFVLPFVAIYAVRRLGYDRRALPLQLAVAAVIIPLRYADHLLLASVIFPLVCWVPAHVALRALCASAVNFRCPGR